MKKNFSQFFYNAKLAWYLSITEPDGGKEILWHRLCFNFCFTFIWFWFLWQLYASLLFSRHIIIGEDFTYEFQSNTLGIFGLYLIHVLKCFSNICLPADWYLSKIFVEILYVRYIFFTSLRKMKWLDLGTYWWAW